jgi:two-component system sensor histidine kinase/response regulator
MDAIDSKPTAELMAELQALKARCACLEQVLSQRNQPQQGSAAHFPDNAALENEERLLTLINATPDIICFKDGAGRWLLAIQADLELFELTGMDYQGKKDSDLAHYSQFYREAFLGCEATDEIAWRANSISRGDEVIPRPDGPPKVYDVIKVPLFYPDARRKGLVVLGRDITERKQAEQTLQAWMSRLHALLNSLQVGILFEDEQRQILLVNPVFYRLFGLPDGTDLTGVDCRVAVIQAKQMFREPDLFHQAVETALARHEAVSGLEFQTVDNRVFECDYVPVYGQDGQRGHLWQYRDVTARVQMEQTLRASEVRNRSLLDAVPDLLFVLDHSGTILDYKADSLNDLLLPPEQFLKRQVAEVFSPPLADGFYARSAPGGGERAASIL